MKIIYIVLMSSLLFSCQKSENSSNNNPSPNPGGQEQGAPTKKTLKFSEILEQDFSAKETMNWGSAESFPADASNEIKMVKLSYFFQENKSVKSKDIDKAKDYCELSTTAAETANGSEITLISGDKLFRFMDFRSEKTEINNLDYRYDAMFKLTFQNSREALGTLNAKQFELACYNVLDLAELKSTIDSKFVFTKKEEKKETK